MRISMYRVKVFAGRNLAGNPATVCVVPEWPTTDTMQRIAVESSSAETAFLLPGEPASLLRWFSPRQEVHLCGHGTMAAAFIVRTHLAGSRHLRFDTCAGRLDVRCEADGVVHLALPRHEPSTVDAPPAALVDGLAASAITTVFRAGRNLYAVLADQSSVQALRPDSELLARLHPDGVSVSAPGDTVDFVCRFFAPSYGIAEDPVSAHPHCALLPYWAKRLGRTTLLAHQLSDRGGEIGGKLLADRVSVSGSVTPDAAGEIVIGSPEAEATHDRELIGDDTTRGWD